METSLPNILPYAVAAFISLILLEASYSVWKKRGAYELKDTIASLSMGFGNVVINRAVKLFITYLAMTFLYQYRIFTIGYEWWAWVLLFLADDFIFYWFHRISHEVRFFWAAHVNHHSSQKMNLGTALRQSWTTPITKILFWSPLALIGFHPDAILFMQVISLIYQFWIHTEFIRNLGPLEYVLNTPSHHRVHHGSDVQYLDANYAASLIIWDRMFGTFKQEKEPVTYGITKNIDTYNPIKIAFHEWQALIHDVRCAKTWHDRINYIVKPPGWSPDGSTLTAKQMQAQLQQSPETPTED